MPIIAEVSYVTSTVGLFYVLRDGKPAWAAITSDVKNAWVGPLALEQARIAGIMRRAEALRGYKTTEDNDARLE